MNFLAVLCWMSTLSGILSSTVSSPQIRILDVAAKASETRLIPRVADYRNSFRPHHAQQNRYDLNGEPLKSYVIYDQYPVKIFKEWKANPPAEFPSSPPPNFLEYNRQNAEFPPEHYFQNGQGGLPPPKPTLAYSSVYSNVIKVFDNSLDGLGRNRFPDRHMRPFGGSVWKSPIEYEPIYSQDVLRRQMYHKLPDNFPRVFFPNDKFHFPTFDEGVSHPPKLFYPQLGYSTHTINYDKENTRHRDEVEVLPDVALKQKNQKTFLCGFIRVNQREFPEGGGPCGRSDDDLPLIPQEYPDYSNLPNDKIPLEHRRQHIQMKRIKRSKQNESHETRQKRNAGFGYGWSSPFGYESRYDGYFGENYPSRGDYSSYGYNRNRNQGYRNRYTSGSRYDEYDDDYHNNDDYNNRGLTGYLTNGGRRYKNRKNNNDDDEDNDDDNNNNNNDNNRDEDSDEEMERMNSGRNDRRNNDDRDRRRNNNNNNNNNYNNNNNDDDDYRDNRRNNNNNRNNSRRYNNNNNNNNNNNSNSNRRYNDRNDSNNNRNRYYSSGNGYSSNNNGYGSGYGGYGSNYGGSYGGGGYGSSYSGNGGYGYGGYGNGFGSF